MSAWKTSLGVAIGSVVLTAGGVSFAQRRAAHEARTLRTQNNQLRLQAMQRVAAATQATPTRRVEPATQAASPTAAIVPAARNVQSYYRNEGTATPLATLQTLAWAGDRGDAAGVGRLLYLDPAAQVKIEAYWASLPEAVRQQWKTMPEMVAGILTQGIMNRPFPDAAILATATAEPVNPDRVRLRLPGVPRDGTEYQRTAEGWKYVVTAAAVDDYLRRTAKAP